MKCDVPPNKVDLVQTREEELMRNLSTDINGGDKMKKHTIDFESVWFSHIRRDDAVYTIAVGAREMSNTDITYDHKIAVAIGVSRCSKLDQFVKRVGRTISQGRATQAIFHRVRGEDNINRIEIQIDPKCNVEVLVHDVTFNLLPPNYWIPLVNMIAKQLECVYGGNAAEIKTQLLDKYWLS